MIVGTTGTSDRESASWEIIETLADDTALVRYTHTTYADVVWYAREAVEGGVLRRLCRCEHLVAGHATHCRDAAHGLDRVKNERVQRRIAALPAPEGARFLRHCRTYWRATNGGACPVCGVVGDVFTPEVRLRDPRNSTWTTVETVEVNVILAYIDAGLVADDVRDLGDVNGVVYWRNGASRLAEITTALTARGWHVVKLAATVRRAS